jgi:hypothetical protein
LESFEENDDFIFQDLIYVIAQIYIPLCLLRNVFCHNDLHLNNILIYKLDNNYIEFVYHLEDGREVKFKTSYIVKIIDYGRCYFNDVEHNMNSDIFLSNVCEEKECNKGNNYKNKCGYHKGYWYLNRTKLEREKKLKNLSDFLCLHIIYKNFIFNNIKGWPSNFAIKKPYLHDLISILEKGSRTYENQLYRYKNDGNDNALVGIYKDLCDVLHNNDSLSEMNERKHQNKTKKGTLHIYCDLNEPMLRPMQFVEEPN